MSTLQETESSRKESDLTEAWKPPRSLFTYDMKVVKESKWLEIMFDPETEYEQDGHWVKMEERQAVLSRDFFLAFSLEHIRSQYFVDACMKAAERCLTGDKVEDVCELLRRLAGVGDSAVSNPWSVHHWTQMRWDYRLERYADTPATIRGKVKREHRLRELLEMVHGRRHMKWHWIEDDHRKGAQ